MLLLSITALGVSIIAIFFASRSVPIGPCPHSFQLTPHDLECLSSGIPVSIGNVEVSVSDQAASELSEALQLLRMDRRGEL